MKKNVFGLKKLVCALSFAFIFAAGLFAVPVAFNETNEANWTDMSYYQVPIYKILDHKDCYIVIYAKNAVGVGKTVIPKKWNRGTPEQPKKLRIRYIGSGKLKPFMAVVENGGEFHHVILTVPRNRQDETWGVVDYRKQIDGIDKDTLEKLDV